MVDRVKQLLCPTRDFESDPALVRMFRSNLAGTCTKDGVRCILFKTNNVVVRFQNKLHQRCTGTLTAADQKQFRQSMRDHLTFHMLDTSLATKNASSNYIRRRTRRGGRLAKPCYKMPKGNACPQAKASAMRTSSAAQKGDTPGISGSFAGLWNSSACPPFCVTAGTK
jgi:hypothetical protein